MAEETIKAIKNKAALLDAYADVLDNLKSQERWYQHRKTVLSDDGEEIEADVLEDDDSDYARHHLSAIRNVIAAVKKLAGV